MLPDGDTFTGLSAARLVTATSSPHVPNVSVRLVQRERPVSAGNLFIEAETDDSDIPRAAVLFHIMLSVPSTKAFASFAVRVAALHPVVEAVRAPGSTLPNAGGTEVKVVVSRAGGDERRLVLLLPVSSDRYQRIIARETSYAKEGDEYVSTITLPALEPSVLGELEWVFEVIDDGRVTTAADETGGYIFEFGWKPVVHTLAPHRVRPGGGGFMILVGEFSNSAERVFFNDKRLDDRDILSISTSEIAIKIPRAHTAKDGSSVTVAVLDKSGLASNDVSFSIDSAALNVKAVVLQSSFEKSTGRVLVPFLCNQTNPPTVFVSVDSIGPGDENPVYSFSIRTSSMLPGASRILSSGNDSIVTLSDRNLFQDSDAVQDEMVTVFVQVSFGDQRGEAVLFISRRLRQNKVGTTVLPLVGGPSRPNSELILESAWSPILQCPFVDDVTVATQWIINGEPVPATSSASTETTKSPMLLGFGNRVLLHHTRMVDYELSIRLVSKRNGKLVADGYSRGRIQGGHVRRPLHVLLNGGMTLIAVPTSQAFTIEGTVVEDTVEPSGTKTKYAWACKESMSKDAECPESLFPASLRVGNRQNASFTVSAPSDWEGKTVEYSLRVSTHERQSEVVVLLVSVVDSRAKVLPAAMLRTATGLPSSGTSRHGFTFSAHDDVILWISGPVPDSNLDFALFHESNHGDLIKSDEDIKFISHNGYWTPAKRKGKFLGISAGSLIPGNYRLQGTFDEKNTSSSVGISSWMFTVAPSVRVVLSDPPISDGFVDQTLFHVSAMSVPSSLNHFFFSLRSIEGGEDKRRRSSPASMMSTVTENCIGGCTGLPSETFTVPAAGRYVLSVDMYSADGSRLIASEEGTAVIRVHDSDSSPSPPSAGNSNDVISKMRSSLQHMDEVTFLSSVLQLSTLSNVPPYVFSDAIDGLQAISATKGGNPLQSARVIEACTSIVRHKQFHDLTLLSSLRRVVQSCVDRTQQVPSGGMHVRDALGSFYGAAADMLSGFSEASSDNSIRSAELSQAMDETRSAAARDILLVLSTGKECGATGQVLVPRDAVSPPVVAGEDTEQKIFDDYRVGISCFNGQVMSLSPEPSLSEVCSDTQEGSSADSSAVNIFTSIERHEVSEHSTSDEILSGPTVYTGILGWRTEGDNEPSLQEIEGGDRCFRSRVSVFANHRVLGNDTFLAEETKIQCRNAGKAFTYKTGSGSESDMAEALTSNISEFELHGDGRISSIVEVKFSGAIRMEVNNTLLRICFQNSTVEGRHSANFAVSLASILGAVIVFIVVLCFVVLYSTSCFDRFDSFSVPSSAAPLNSFATSIALTQSTRDTSSTLNSEDNSLVLNAWEAEYGSLSAMADRDVDSDSTAGHDSRDLRIRGTMEVDDFVSRGSMAGFRRASLADVPTVIPWMANSTTSFNDRNRQIDFLGSCSSSSLDYFVPDSYGRADPNFR